MTADGGEGTSVTAGGLRIAGLARGRPVRLVVDGQEVLAHEGESIAAALWAAGRRLARFTARTGEPRGYVCGMGVCQDCLMTVDGRPNVRACMAAVRDGQRVETQRGLGQWEEGRWEEGRWEEGR